MVKILVKQDSIDVRPENDIVSIQLEEEPISNIDRADEYEIDFADRSTSEHLDSIIGTIEADSDDLGFVQDLQTYVSEENVICAPDLVLVRYLLAYLQPGGCSATRYWHYSCVRGCHGNQLQPMRAFH